MADKLLVTDGTELIAWLQHWHTYTLSAHIGKSCSALADKATKSVHTSLIRIWTRAQVTTATATATVEL